jgi:hypothetical protein
MPFIATAPPEVGGVDERGAGGGEPTHEGISSSPVTRLVGVHGGEIGGFRIPRDVSLAARPQCDSIPIIITAPPEVGGVFELKRCGMDQRGISG